ncbi:MAG: hypothetical protein R8K46_02800 [Mariprofundaceae bacterium]
MIRVLILLLLSLSIAALLAMNPLFAQQAARIEAFGWVFETKQGLLLVVLLLVLATLWALQRIIRAILGGPSHLWQSLRMGSRKRRWGNIRDGLANLIDMRGDLGAKGFKKGGRVLPGWGGELLQLFTLAASEQPLPGSGDDALKIALAARLATDPDASNKPDLAKRKAFLQAWLNIHPGAPLALQRFQQIAEEEADWTQLTELLEEEWKRGGRSSASIKPKLTRAYLALASKQPEHTLLWLRKAQRLGPDSPAVILALGNAYVEQNDRASARRLWMAHLQKNDDLPVAKALRPLLQDDALKAYRKIDKHRDGMPVATQWLRAQMAHDADLTGLALEHMEELIQHHPSPIVWQTQGDWFAQDDEWEKAAECYKNALS